MTRRRLASPPTLAAAGVILGALTVTVGDGEDAARERLLDSVTDDGRIDTLAGPVSAFAIAHAATVIVDKILEDVETLISVNRERTLDNLGLWVAREGSR